MPDELTGIPTTPARRLSRHSDSSDALLAHRVAEGNRDAFAALYDKYSRPAYSLAKRICVVAELAEDVVQEAFLALWRDPSRYQPSKGGFGTWLMTLVHHRAVDVVRRESAHRRRVSATELQDDTFTSVPAAADLAVNRVVGAQVREALHDLPSEQREIIALAYFGGYTQGEVAALTGMPLGTVKSRTFAGLRKLRARLSNLGSGPERESGQGAGQ